MGRRSRRFSGSRTVHRLEFKIRHGRQDNHPGNPVRMSAVPRLPASRRPPWLGEHTAEVLSAELGMSGEQLAALRDGGVIA